MKNRAIVMKVVVHALLLLGCVVTLYPLVWMFFSSFKTTSSVMSVPPSLFPKEITIENYITIFTDNIGRYFFNSAYIAILRTGIGIYTSALLGYIFAKFDFKFKNIIFGLLIATMMVPWIVTIVPLYNIFNRIHLLNTHYALIIPYMGSSYGVFLVRSFMHQLPNSVIEAARIDGCSEFRLFNKIIIPMVSPALSALGIILFLAAWDDYLWPFLVINNEELYTLTVGLAKYAFKQYTVAYGPVLAGSVISIFPVILIYVLLQKNIVAGITIGGVKG